MGVTKTPEERHSAAIVVLSTEEMKKDVTEMAEELGYECRSDLVRDLIGKAVSDWKRKK